MYSIEHLALRMPDLLLPNKEIDLYAWSVIACDQFTSDVSYWDKVAHIVKDKPSTFRLMLPEIYIELHKELLPQYFESIRSHTRTYLKNSIFTTHKDCFLLVKRKTLQNRTRYGIMMQIDLAQYDPNPHANTIIKSTEAIVSSRLPKRIEMRKNTMLDLPHVLMLYNDPEKVLVQALLKIVEKTAYSTDLMLGGGHVTGFFCNREEGKKKIEAILGSIFRETISNNKHTLFAVGDGNHSLMAAKQVWQDRGSNMNAPERWALVELVNVFDEGLPVEPIHRVLFDADYKMLCSTLQSQGDIVEYEKISDAKQHSKKTSAIVAYRNNSNSMVYALWHPHNTHDITVLNFEKILEKNENCYKKIDFTHEEEYSLSFSEKKESKNITIILPHIPKECIFEYVYSHTVFPRKSFSLGEAEEKRYYIEACLHSSEENGIL